MTRKVTMMRSYLFAGLVSMAAFAGCDAPMAEDVDAFAIDAGGDGAAAVSANVTLERAPAAAPAPASEPQAAEQLGALTTRSGQLGMVMDLGEGHAVGPIARLSDRRAADVVLRRAHAPSEDEQALVGAPVALYQADGLACRATIARLVEVADLVPAAGTHRSDRALWRLAEERNGITIVAELDAPGCDDPIFVEQGETPRAAAHPHRVDAGSATEADAIARLQALPRFAAIEAEYRAHDDFDAAVPTWSDLPDAATTVTELTIGDARYLTAEITREAYCGEFGGTVFAIWQRTGDGLRLVVDSDVAPDGYDLAFDSDHDGVPELAAIAGEIEPVLEEDVFEGCGC